MNIVKICKFHGKLANHQIKKYFRKRKPNKKGIIKLSLQIECIKCNTIRQVKWQKKNPDKIKKYQENTKNHPDYAFRNRKEFLWRKYKITIEDYKKLLIEQSNICAICKKEDLTIEANSLRLKGLCIDHCHRTGKIRGLLCNKCNPMIGYAQDSIEILQSAIDYIRHHNK